MSEGPTVPHGGLGRVAGLLARRDVRLLGLAVAVELVLLATYFAATPAEPTTLRYVLYPFVWVNVSGLAVLKTTPPRAARGQRWGATLAAGLYLLTLLYVTGFVGIDLPHNPPELVGVTVNVASPGWSRVRLVAPTFHLTLVPFKWVGYLALSYLVYVTLLDAASAALAGALGLGACLSCTFPILASLGAGLFGTTTVLAGAYAYSVDLATATFLLAVGLLYWRPDVGGWLAMAVADRRTGEA